jgi:RHS repeat-associated protein
VLYIDKLMEIETSGSAMDFRHYLGDLAILTKTGSLNDSTPGVKYTFRDRLGGISMLGDSSGTATEYRGYDAYGKPRNSNWSDKSPATINSTVTDRGFTDHEHLDDWQLIHMNGRGYDYNLGRFWSVDPFIQDPGNSQSINAYAYIMNNPLSGTDPTGYTAKEVASSTTKTTKSAPTGSHIKSQVTERTTTTFTDGTSVKTTASLTNNGASFTSTGYNSDGKVGGKSSGSVSSADGGGSNAAEIGAEQQGESSAGVMSDDEIIELMLGESGRDYAAQLAETGEQAGEIAAELLGAINPADPINLIGGGVIKIAASSLIALTRTGVVARRTIDILGGGRRLTGKESESLRGQARRIWEAQVGTRASVSGLEVHHRIPLEWSHLFPDAYPNRVANLVGAPNAIHTNISIQWAQFKAAKSISGVEITASIVAERAAMIDRQFVTSLVPLASAAAR